MRSKLLLLAASFLFGATLSAQRNLEHVAEVERYTASVTCNGVVMMTGNFQTYLSTFDDEDGYQRHPYPVIDGVPLMYRNPYTAGNPEPAIIYNSYTYVPLVKDEVHYLYRFNGFTFTRISIPGTIMSDPIVFGSYLYILSQSGSTVQLYRYNGTTVTAVPSGTLPVATGNDLMVAGSYLYLIATDIFRPSRNTIKRYNGTSVTTLPWEGFATDGRVTDIFAVGHNAYFNVGGRKVYYYNGTSVSLPFSITSGYFDSKLWRDNLYILPSGTDATIETPLYRLNAGTASVIAMPAGTKIHVGAELAVFGDALHFMAGHDVTGNKVLRYNGSGFTNIFNIPIAINRWANIFTREGKLIIHPDVYANRLAWESDGTVATEIRAPEGQTLYGYLASTDCQHLWYSQIGIEQFLMKESKGCPPPATTSILPEYFFDFDRADVNLWGKDRGWCWNEIIIDWGIEPCEFPDPCPDPEFSASMFNKNNQLAWQKMIDKPSVLAVPLKDDQPYSTRIKALNGQQEDLFVVADNLVEKGIESISVSMQPKNGFVKITATTDVGKSVPLRAELLDKNGQVLWSKDFMAPFSQQITDKIQQPGQTLRFSIPGTELKSVITNLDIYPNPSKGQLYLQVKSDKPIADAELTIFTLLGQRIMSRKIKIPFSEQLKLTDTKPGMYVLKLKTAEGEMSRIIKLE